MTPPKDQAPGLALDTDEVLSLLREKYGQCPPGGMVGMLMSERQLRGLIDALGVDLP